MKDKLFERAEAIASAARSKLAEDRKALEAIRSTQKPDALQKVRAAK